ncbi:Metastasis-associated protein MTA3 [Papilio machaon]|uniref:Metastasis-associated protein MTA3 n=1 Tax=Papilio machaon TaxID=76193 RepID=A0A0N1IG06_PAPMA|nr:Metastasis-associated protein MTA3 [Papilio machaon]
MKAAKIASDCVYFETSSTSPYQIRRIEELNKTASGNVEAKVMCFYRRRDLPNPLIQLADKHQMAQSEDSPVAMKLKKICLKTPIGEEQAAQAVLDPALGHFQGETMRRGMVSWRAYTGSLGWSLGGNSNMKSQITIISNDNDSVGTSTSFKCAATAILRDVSAGRPSLGGYRLEHPATPSPPPVPRPAREPHRLRTGSRHAAIVYPRRLNAFVSPDAKTTHSFRARPAPRAARPPPQAPSPPATARRNAAPRGTTTQSLCYTLHCSRHCAVCSSSEDSLT